MRNIQKSIPEVIVKKEYESAVAQIKKTQNVTVPEVIDKSLNPPNCDMKQLGLNIKELRVRNNLSQTDLAKKCGVSPSEISKYESGIKKVVNLALCAKISFYCNTSLERLFYGAMDFNGNGEHYYSFNCECIDLYGLARDIYQTDAEFFCMISSPDFLEHTDLISAFKDFIVAYNSKKKNAFVQEILDNLMAYNQKVFRAIRKDMVN